MANRLKMAMEQPILPCKGTSCTLGREQMRGISFPIFAKDVSPRSVLRLPLNPPALDDLGAEQNPKRVPSANAARMVAKPGRNIPFTAH